MTGKRAAVAVVAVLAVAFAFAGVVGLASAGANSGGDEPCVPSEAWTETIPGTPDQWWNFSPNDHHAPFVGPPGFPTDQRGTWQGPHENGGPQQGTYGTFPNGNPHKGGNWFHREQGTPDQVIEHPAVECPTEPTDPPTTEPTEPPTTDPTEPTEPPTTEPTEPPTTEPTEPPTECPDRPIIGGPCDPTTPTEPPEVIPPTSEPPVGDPPTIEQRCTPTKCVRITTDGGEVINREVYRYPDATEEGM